MIKGSSSEFVIQDDKTLITSTLFEPSIRL